jgi:hypothetical protein
MARITQYFHQIGCPTEFSENNARICVLEMLQDMVDILAF